MEAFSLAVVIRGDGAILMGITGHEALIKKFQLDDSGERVRISFLRARFDGKSVSYPYHDIPTWYENHCDIFEEKIKKMYEKIKPIMEEYATQRRPIEKKYIDDWYELEKNKLSCNDYQERQKALYIWHRDTCNPLEKIYIDKMQAIVDGG